MKDTPLLTCPWAVTTTGPVPASRGTATRISSSLQLIAEAHTPLKLTPPISAVGPNPSPRIVTTVPSTPSMGLTVPTAGPDPPAPVTVNSTPALGCPPTVTTTSPVAAPGGTITVIALPLQLAGVDHTPLKLTPLVPCTAPTERPKLVPRIVTTVPSGPDSGVTESIVGSLEPEGSDPGVATPNNASSTPAKATPAKPLWNRGRRFSVFMKQASFCMSSYLKCDSQPNTPPGCIELQSFLVTTIQKAC